MKQDLGPERSNHVEEHPEQYTDADKFRILHAKARFRTVVTLAAVYFAAPTYAAMSMGGYKSGKHFFRMNSLPLTAGLVLLAIPAYNIHHYIAGYRNIMWKEYNYAKCIRQLRNVQIKQ